MSFAVPDPEPVLRMRRDPEAPRRPPAEPPRKTFFVPVRKLVACLGGGLILLVLLAAGGYFFAQHWVRTAAGNALPQIDGTLPLAGFVAPVSVLRDAHGVPHLHAASIDDLLLAQGFVTAQDRLFQMDLLRRHAAGELAEVIGATVIGHDRLQRTLQIRAAADRAFDALGPADRHMLEQYARGVNASIAVQSPHLPLEFRVLRYAPRPWTGRDSLLVALAMFEDLTNTFSAKLARESLLARLAPALPAEQRAQLEEDLYPVGSWRDHPPSRSVPDLSIEGPPIEDVPLDESQSSLRLPPRIPTAKSLIASITATFQTQHGQTCLDCVAGSNNWVVSGAHSLSGKPLLSNDMHLGHSLPGIWYEADLQADETPATGVKDEGFHTAGVSLPGVPFIVVGHNRHIAWGFTNLGADVQDVYVETTRGSGAEEEFQGTDGSWHPVLHLKEPIKVHGGRDLAFEVLATEHGGTVTPILNPALTSDVTQPGGHPRTLSLRWTIYDPKTVRLPSFEVSSASDWPSFLAAFRDWGGPAQNVVYADDAGHIGFHAMGRIPVRGPRIGNRQDQRGLLSFGPPPLASQLTPAMRAQPDPLDTTEIKALPASTSPLLGGLPSGVPVVPSAGTEWSGYIPFDDLPAIFDPAGGVIATANARTSPDDYGYPLTLNWAAPYRNERIWHLLAHRTRLTAADMLAIQTDFSSDFDRMLSERIVYALDHPPARGGKSPSAAERKTLKTAADLLRTFKGVMSEDSAAAAIVSAVHHVLWPMLLESKLSASSGKKPHAEEIDELYRWGERDYALEQILMHTPPRWLPAGFAEWNDFLAAAVLRALAEAHAPEDLTRWRYGGLNPVDIESPIFTQSAPLRQLLGVSTGTGPRPQAGDHTTIKQVDRTFGPSERFTADLSDLDGSTLNIVTGQSGNPYSPWYLDQFAAWSSGKTFPLPFSSTAVKAATTHSLTLTPR